MEIGWRGGRPRRLRRTGSNWGREAGLGGGSEKGGLMINSPIM